MGASGCHQGGKQIPQVEVQINPPPTEVGNWLLEAEAGSKPPQGVQLTCPWRERELGMAGPGKNGLSKRLAVKWVRAKALHTQSVAHPAGGRLSARFMIMWPG